jgi:hypothetical protein
MSESVVSRNIHMQRGRENRVVKKKTTTTTEESKKSESTSSVSVKSTKVVELTYKLLRVIMHNIIEEIQGGSFFRIVNKVKTISISN